MKKKIKPTGISTHFKLNINSLKEEHKIVNPLINYNNIMGQINYLFKIIKNNFKLILNEILFLCL